MKQLLQEVGFEEMGLFLSSKENWELYVRPMYVSLHQTIADEPELAREAQNFMTGSR
jgi:hypothetical protein